MWRNCKVAVAAFIHQTEQKIEVITNDVQFGMRKSDWKRIRRLVDNISKNSKVLSNIYSISFGAGISGLLTYLSLMNQILSLWIKPTLMSASLFLLVLAGVIFYLDFVNIRKQKEVRNNISTEMEEIENLYGHFNS